LGQILAAYSRGLKEAIRDKASLFWTMSWPLIWLIIAALTFVGDVPQEVVPYVRASMTVSMMVFALMIAGMSHLPAGIAWDRKNGLFAKLKSMPIEPYRDFIGRVSAVGTFALLAAAVVLVLGFALGARFTGSGVAIPQAIGFLLLTIVASAGVGLIVGTLIRKPQGAVTTGVAIAVILAALSGVFAPADLLPAPLQVFARVYPISSARTSIVYLLVGPDAVGYNPLTSGQITLTVTLSFALLLVGTLLYSKRGWSLE